MLGEEACRRRGHPILGGRFAWERREFCGKQVIA